MRTLILFRHAKSARPAGVPDHARGLAPRGHRDARAMAAWLAARGPLPERVLCSDATRTRETVALALETWTHEGAHPAPQVSYLPGLYLASGGRILRIIAQEADDAESVMVVGHNPGIHGLARALAHPGTSEAHDRLDHGFPTAAMAILTLAIDGWDDPALTREQVTAERVAVQHPGDLD